MNKKRISRVFRPCSFGSVAFLWRKSIAINIEKTSTDDAGSCLCSSFENDYNEVIKVTAVYYPCHESRPGYNNELDRSLGFIDSVASTAC